MIAFGYVRVEDDDETAVDELCDLVEDSRAAEDYDLREVYVDRTPPGSVVRPGFQALVGALEREEGAHVLVPDLDHLSPLPAVRTALEAKLGSLGSTVVTCGGAACYFWPRWPPPGEAAPGRD